MKAAVAALAAILGLVLVTACAGHPAAARPLGNSCRAGYVTFTFDDGPDGHTQAMIDRLRQLHVRAVFFVIGDKAAARPGLVREEARDGFVVGNHTYYHLSFTGSSTGTAALSGAQVRSELSADSRAIEAAGAPRPAVWRPPYGDVSAKDNWIAHTLGLRVVMDWGKPGANIVDSQDWRGISAQQIVTNVTRGYPISVGHEEQYVPGIHAGSIIAMHDGIPDARNTIAALPGIVAYMNTHSLCATSTVRPNATGGVVPNY